MATLLGFSAILMWSLLAFLTAASGTVPPFQLSAMTFSIGALVGFGWLWATGRGIAAFRQPSAVWAVGVVGLFGYHALYFAALRNAPPQEASLIAYLWPLLIVVGSAALPGEKLRWYHGLGALLGLAGAGFVIAGGRGLAIDPAYAFGYAMAAGCALTWTAYSLLSRRFSDVPSEIVAGFCLATAVLSLLAHLVFETTVVPEAPSEWLAVLTLGLLPVGAAFYAWDHAVKHGDIQLVGAASYAAPIISTLVLVIGGRAEPTLALGLGALLVTLGAALAALPRIRDAFRGSRDPAAKPSPQSRD